MKQITFRCPDGHSEFTASFHEADERRILEGYLKNSPHCRAQVGETREVQTPTGTRIEWLDPSKVTICGKPMLVVPVKDINDS